MLLLPNTYDIILCSYPRRLPLHCSSVQISPASYCCNRGMDWLQKVYLALRGHLSANTISFWGLYLTAISTSSGDATYLYTLNSVLFLLVAECSQWSRRIALIQQEYKAITRLKRHLSPQTHSFLALPLQLPEDFSSYCLYVHNNTLVVHSKYHISKFTAGQAGQLLQHSQAQSPTRTPIPFQWWTPLKASSISFRGLRLWLSTWRRECWCRNSLRLVIVFGKTTAGIYTFRLETAKGAVKH